MRDAEHRPAFYAARVGGWRDWWTILHPPYTAWHLAYVVIGASMLPTLDTTRLDTTRRDTTRRDTMTYQSHPFRQ